MRDGSIRTAFGALLATTALATPAFAQTYEPMERQAPDDNGVDVISGKVTIPLKSVTVGSGDSSMTYSRGFAAGQPWDTFDVKIFHAGAPGNRRSSHCSATSAASPAARQTGAMPTATAAR